MKPYEKYKESRIPWVDELPVAWEEFRLRYLGALDAGGVDKKINEGESLYKSVHYMDVYRGSLRNIFDSPNYLIVSATPQKRDKCILRKGDVLFTTSSETPNDIGHSCVIGEDLNDTLFGYHLLRLRVTDKIDFQFRKYLFGANYLRTWFSYRAVGMTRYGISNIDFADARIMIPPIDEQKKISNYLDQKVSQIDDLIQNKQELIDLLKEQRISVICSAVTKGIDSTAEMKDSGNEWLGYIPSHWRVVPAKALFAQSKETRHETDVQLTASQKYGIISQEDYMERQNYKIVLADKGLENWKHVEPNDFIISLRSFQGGLEISYIPGCITWHYIVLKPKAGVEPEYFKWLFKSPRYIQALQRTANFIRDGQDLRFSNFVQVPLPLIPMDEQKEIAEYLNKETARIDSIIADITEQIEKLKEYRQSVISEVVTGKVAVE
ncbi:MAG: restriction endonuclease subunit S [Clostridiales bacterium]|uniref:restriction endonuclease subunit S n=1 Tax=Eisenbergiella massiliensis TaxID=1720294 RepID=UPI0023F2FE58|nr:restriction endonuclease subunit S [Eisenbergiella massiliensis]MCI6937872.1 restriction endonuclease subunit S [Clostridiales bacterium]